MLSDPIELLYLVHCMWQSQIEIEYYSVAYLERITEFDALYIALNFR